MKKLITVVALVLLLVSVPAAEAQQAKKIPRIGYLLVGSASSEAPRVNAFRDGLRQLGYIEGQNIVIEYRYAESRAERLPELAAELVRLKVDVIVAGGPPIRAAKDATNTVPIVMAFSTDPVASGYAKSLARPGGNLTGLSSMAVELSGKRLELFKESFPKALRLAVLWHASSGVTFKETQTAKYPKPVVSPSAGLRINSVEPSKIQNGNAGG